MRAHLQLAQFLHKSSAQRLGHPALGGGVERHLVLLDTRVLQKEQLVLQSHGLVVGPGGFVVGRRRLLSVAPLCAQNHPTERERADWSRVLSRTGSPKTETVKPARTPMVETGSKSRRWQRANDGSTHEAFLHPLPTETRTLGGQMVRRVGTCRLMDNGWVTIL